MDAVLHSVSVYNVCARLLGTGAYRAGWRADAFLYGHGENIRPYFFRETIFESRQIFALVTSGALIQTLLVTGILERAKIIDVTPTRASSLLMSRMGSYRKTLKGEDMPVELLDLTDVSDETFDLDVVEVGSTSSVPNGAKSAASWGCVTDLTCTFSAGCCC